MASMNQWSLSLSKEVVKDREAWHAAVHEVQRVRHNNNFCVLILELDLCAVKYLYILPYFSWFDFK